MATLSSDTGGKAFFDSNDFAPAFARVQADTSEYYAVGYHSTNLARDGKYRKLTVKVTGRASSLNTGPATTRPRIFATPASRIGNRNSRTSWPAICRPPILRCISTPCTSASTITATTCRFRCSFPPCRFPSSKAATRTRPHSTSSARWSTRARPIGRARQTVKLDLNQSLNARQKNIQYTTSFNLPPGKYTLKFVVRENETGRMGSFVAEITLPDLKKAPLKMSSVVLASMRQPSKNAGPGRSAGAQWIRVRA